MRRRYRNINDTGGVCFTLNVCPHRFSFPHTQTSYGLTLMVDDPEPDNIWSCYNHFHWSLSCLPWLDVEFNEI
ncbi:MAG: hypothetical protein ACD_39C00751G0003 [uncultured bacterium]|nr:MAG: hypothetical protein ACD_39C00751G0003 [uncultured bacterium]